MSSPNALHVMIVGGGVAGLEIATGLARRRHGTRRAPALHISLLDSDTAHIWKPMLHTIAAGTRDVHLQQVAYAQQARSAGFVYHPGAMCGLDRARREVVVAPLKLPNGQELLSGRRIPYDALVLAVGSQANDFGTPGASEHCHVIDSRRQADAFNQTLRAHLLRAVAHGEDLDIGIVGGGATGVELAAELVQLAEVAEIYGAAGASTRLKVILLERGPRLLAAFPEDIAQAAKSRLEALGVEVRLGTAVSSVGPEGFRLGDGEMIHAALKVWSAGVKAPDFLRGLDGLETNMSNQLVVRSSLQTTLDSAIFALGDCASFVEPGSQRPLPPTAQVAHQQARHLVRHLPPWLADDRRSSLPGFSYRNFGSLVSLARYDAYGSVGRFGIFRGASIKGRLAQLSSAMLYRSHQSRLHGFRKGWLLWLVDRINARLRPPIRLD